MLEHQTLRQDRLIKWYGHVLFAVVTLVALSMTWYSMMDLATGQFGLPQLLSIGVSLAFDGAAVLSALFAIEYAKTADSGVLAELGTFLFIGTSVYITVQHAVLENYGLVGMVMFGAAPIIVGFIFKLYLNFLTRQARREAGRIVERLPVAGKLTWLRYPKQSFRLLSVAMQTRLVNAADRLDMPMDRHGILGTAPVTLQATVETPVKDTETLLVDKGVLVQDTSNEAQQITETVETKQLTSGDNLSLPVWLPNEPLMSVSNLVSICVDNGVRDFGTILGYARDIKGHGINEQTVRKSLYRAIGRVEGLA